MSKTAEGEWIRCGKCKGTGKVLEERGILTSKTIEVACNFCNGQKEVFAISNCPLMTNSEFRMTNGFTSDGNYSLLYTQCIGRRCAFWDRNKDDGCLKRKSMMMQIYGKC
jgi:hypothetical protein